MDEPPPEDWTAYHRVKRWFVNQELLVRYGYLTQQDTLFSTDDKGVELPIPAFGGTWETYQEGYFEAAKRLVDVYGDLASIFTVYPILFLYRHYLELALKSLIFDAAHSFGEPRPTGLSSVHNLTKLFERFTGIVNRRPEVVGNLEHLRRILDEFTQFDPDSMETRYGLEKDFRTSTLQQRPRIDLQNVQTVMEKIYNELANLEAKLEHFRFQRG